MRCRSRRRPFPLKGKLLPALGNSLTIAAHRLPSQSVTVSFMADQKLRQHCHDRRTGNATIGCRIGLCAAAYACGPIGDPFCPEALSRRCRRLHVSTRHSISICRMLPASLPIPKELQSEGIQRYGFHAAFPANPSYISFGNDLPETRLIIAHLGNGASVTAVRDGKSIDTSMGLTPSGGVVMGTRSAEPLDPGVLIYLMREKEKARRAQA